MNIGDGDSFRVEYIDSDNSIEASASTNGGERSYLVLRMIGKEGRNGNARHPVSARIVDFGQVCVLGVRSVANKGLSDRQATHLRQLYGELGRNPLRFPNQKEMLKVNIDLETISEFGPFIATKR